MSPQTLTRGRRLLTGTTVAALTAGVLAFAPTTANAAQTGEPVTTADWGISATVQTYFTGFANLYIPAFEGARCEGANPSFTSGTTQCSDITWGAGTTSTEGDETTTSVSGKIVLWASTGGQWISVANPAATFDGDGVGELTAEVSYGTTTPVPFGTSDPQAVATFWESASVKTPQGEPTRVKLLDLVDDVDTDVFADYPYGDVDFADITTDGVREISGLKGLWSDALSTHLAGPDGIADSQNGSNDGFAYATAFQNAVTNNGARVRYAEPISFTVQPTVASTSASVSESVPGSLKVKVDGTGFSKSGVGIYVSLGEEGAFSSTNADAFVKTNWLNAGLINVDGSFATTLALTDADIAKLDPAKSYVVYTQKAHGQSETDPSQNSETPVTIDFDSLKKTPTISADPVAQGTPASVTVNVAPAKAGSVALSVDGAEPTTAEVSEEGEATFSLSGLSAGSHELSATYEGDAWYIEGAATATLTVEPTTEPTVTPSKPISAKGLTAAYGRGGKVTVTVPAAGQVTVPGLGSRSAPRAGSVSFAIGKTRAVGTKTYTVAFKPAAANVTAPKTVKVTVKITKANVGKRSVKVNKKPTTRKKGKATVTVVGVKGATAPTGKVRIKLTKGKKNKFVTVNLSKGKRVVTLPKLAKGKWTIRVAYLGNANYAKRGYAKVGTVKITKK